MWLTDQAMASDNRAVSLRHRPDARADDVSLTRMTHAGWCICGMHGQLHQADVVHANMHPVRSAPARRMQCRLRPPAECMLQSPVLQETENVQPTAYRAPTNQICTRWQA